MERPSTNYVVIKRKLQILYHFQPNLNYSLFEKNFDYATYFVVSYVQHAAEFLTEKMLYWHMANQNRCFEYEFIEKLT